MPQKFTSYSSEGWMSKIKVSSGLISPEGSLLDLQMAVFSLCPHLAFPLRSCPSGVSSSSDKDTSSIELEPHPYGLFNGPISRYNHMKGLGLLKGTFGKRQDSVCNIL